MRQKFTIKPVKHARYKWRVTYTIPNGDGTAYKQKYFVSKGQAQDWIAVEGQAIEVAGPDLGELAPEERRALSIWRESMDELGNGLASLDTLVKEAVQSFRRTRSSITLKKAVEATLARRENEGRKARTIEDLTSKLARFEREIGSTRIVSSVTTDEIDSWLMAIPLGSQSVINYRRCVHALFSECVRRNWCEKNPVAAALKPREPERDIGILTTEEARSVLGACPSRVLPGVAIQLFCGLRESEVMDLTWKHIDLSRGFVRVDGKTGKRLVPMQPNAVQWLTPFERKDSERMWPAARFPYSHAVRKAFEAAEVKRTPNCLRHSFCTYRLAQCQDLAKTALEAGNSPRMIQKHYAELVVQSEGESWFNILPIRTASDAA